MFKRLRILFVVCAVCFLKTSHAQLIDDQLWLDFTLKVNAPTNWYYGAEAGWRSSYENSFWNQYNFRPFVGFNINNSISVGGAAALFHVNFGEPGDVTEFRLQQEFAAKWPRFKFGFVFWRARLEERWFTYEVLQNEFELRGRALIGFQTASLPLFNGKHSIYGQTLIEGFRELNEPSVSVPLVNRDRIHLALGYRFSKNWGLEAHYIWQRSLLPVLNDLETSVRVIRIRVYYTISTN